VTGGPSPVPRLGHGLRATGHANGTREAAMPRDNIILQCTECKSRNYFTDKNKKTKTARLEFKKFCKKCRLHRAHKETK
jgi:large subunit ribosomal protein L33